MPECGCGYAAENKNSGGEVSGEEDEDGSQASPNICNNNAGGEVPMVSRQYNVSERRGGRLLNKIASVQ